jgi:hypothetical protein
MVLSAVSENCGNTSIAPPNIELEAFNSLLGRTCQLQKRQGAGALIDLERLRVNHPISIAWGSELWLTSSRQAATLQLHDVG